MTTLTREHLHQLTEAIDQAAQSLGIPGRVVGGLVADDKLHFYLELDRPQTACTTDPTLALLVWLLNLDGDQPDCYDLCWRDYVGLRTDPVLTDCRNSDGCPFGQVLLRYPPATIQHAVRALVVEGVGP